MPLLTCPNDNASMQTANRSGVEFDICPTCRGVWLDRGELEKLMSVTSADHDERRQARPVEPFPGRRTEHYRDRGDYEDEGYGDERAGPRKRKGFSLLDIFD